MKNVAIIGSGSWGVALAIHLAKMGNKVKVWSFMQEEADIINNEKKCKFLPDVDLPDGILCLTNMEDVIKDTDIILHVTPSKFVRNTIKQYKDFIQNQHVIMCSKGFESGTLNTLSEIMDEEMPNVKTGVFSGPSHAEEVATGIPTAIVIASKHKEVQEEVQELFMNNAMRIYTSDDVLGVEIGGATKNIIAFCAGVAAGIGLGDNSFAALVTRGLVEIRRLGVKMGGNEKTFYGLSGLGDLIVTCLSEHSRNRRAGKLIGQGYSIDETREKVGMTIESIDNIEVAYELSKKYNVELPIVDAVYNVLYNNLKPADAVEMLMSRDKKSE